MNRPPTTAERIEAKVWQRVTLDSMRNRFPAVGLHTMRAHLEQANRQVDGYRVDRPEADQPS